MSPSFRNMLIGAALAVAGVACAQTAPQTPELAQKWKDKSLFTIPVNALDGADGNLGQYSGKVVLVVNCASKCGYTRQYSGLQKLWDEYKDKGLVVIGFPSNDFGGQEPGTAEEIATFCSKNYGVTFPMMAKCQTKAGDGQSPVFEFLGTRTGKLPGWNFCKYLVGKDGQPISFYASGIGPDSEELKKAIDAALAAAAPAAPTEPASPATPAAPASPAPPKSGA
jgi:glutathione peroxidase